MNNDKKNAFQIENPNASGIVALIVLVTISFGPLLGIISLFIMIGLVLLYKIIKDNIKITKRQ